MAFAISFIVAIVIDLIIAYFFGEIAEQKGYSMVKYYILCVFFSLAGWIMVCALPNKKN